MADDQDPIIESPQKAWEIPKEARDSFTNWVQTYVTKEHPEDENYRIEAGKQLLIEKHADGSIWRKYFDLNHSGNYYMRADFSYNPTKAIILITDGSAGQEGHRSLKYSSIDPKEIYTVLILNGIDISIRYDFDGQIKELFLYASESPRDFCSFDFSEGQPKIIPSKSGNYRIIYKEDDEFLDCIGEREIEDEEGEKIKIKAHYRVPKQVNNFEEALDSLVPRDLMEDPYNAPASEDLWYGKSFLDAFGIKRVA